MRIKKEKQGEKLRKTGTLITYIQHTLGKKHQNLTFEHEESDYCIHFNTLYFWVT